MAERDGRLVLEITDDTGANLTGHARIEIEHRQVTDRHRLDDADVSEPIVFDKLYRAPLGFYSARVRLDDSRRWRPVYKH